MGRSRKIKKSRRMGRSRNLETKTTKIIVENGFIAVKFTATGNTVSTRLRGAQKALTG